MEQEEICGLCKADQKSHSAEVCGLKKIHIANKDCLDCPVI